VGDWKVIVHQEKQSRKIELFDLVSDPAEANNLAESQPGRVEQLLKAMEDIAARDRDAMAKD